MQAQNTNNFTIANPVQNVFTVATNETMVRSVIPGAKGGFAQLFGAAQVSTVSGQTVIVFTNKAGQQTTVSFTAASNNSTMCRIAGLEHNPKVSVYAEIVKNHFVGLALADYVRKQRQFTTIARGITYAFLAGLVVWMLSLGPGTMAADATVVDWGGAVLRVLVVGVLIIAPLAAIVPMIFVWPFIELLKHFVFSKPLAVMLERLKKQAPGASVSLYSHSRIKHDLPMLTKSVKYARNYQYRGVLALVNSVVVQLNRIMSFSGDARARRAYKYGVLKLEPYTMVQLNSRDVAWVLPLHSNYAHAYIERNQVFSRSLGGEAIALEGDFAKYFTVYVAKGEQVEALRLASPEVMAAIIDHALPFDVEVRDSTLIFHTRLKQFLDPIWVARSLTAAQRVSSEVDHRGDTPQSHRPLLSAYRMPFLESQSKLTVLYTVPWFLLFFALTFETRDNEGALSLPYQIPLNIVLGFLMAYLFAMLVLLVLTFWHNRFSPSIAGIVDTGLDV